MNTRKRFMTFFFVICLLFSLTACGQKEDEGKTVTEKWEKKAEKVRADPIVFRFDEKSGATYMYLDEEMCILYQPSQRKKVLCIGHKKDGTWLGYYYIMKFEENKYVAYAPKMVMTWEQLNKNFVAPFLDAKIISTDENAGTLVLDVTYSNDKREWTGEVTKKNMLKIANEELPKSMYYYYRGTRDYQNIVNNIKNEVVFADSNFGEAFEQHVKDILNEQVK